MPAPRQDHPTAPQDALRLLLLRALLLRALALALAPLALRIMALGGELGTGSGDLRGFASDVSMALGLSGALCLLLPPSPDKARSRAPFRRLLSFVGPYVGPYVGIVTWTLLMVGNDAHVRALGGSATFDHIAYLLDPTFFAGSGVPVLLAPRTWLLILAGAALVALASRFDAPLPSRPVRIGGAMALAASILVLVLWPLDPAASTWRQTNGLENGIRALGNPPSTDGSELAATDTADTDTADTDTADTDTADGPGGAPLVPSTADRSVILVMLEGVSGGHLPSVAAHQGVQVPPFLPLFDGELQRLAHSPESPSRPWIYPHFVNHQRQTNRGEYALLCGRLPRLLGGTPKMSEAVGEDAPTELGCLPEALGRAGYATVYLQAAPLDFMLKDRFMPAIGFEQSLGDEYFENAHQRNDWGVDDRTFLEQSRRKIEELRAADRPYFLGLLTVGTHHPFNVPPDHPSAFPEGSLPWALSYLDAALAPFVRWLGESGVLDDTLVLFVSDESAGFGQAPDAIAGLQAQAWGLAVALVPTASSTNISGDSSSGNSSSGDGSPAFSPHLFGQTDLPLSILDHLSISDHLALDADPGFGGRSLFREQGGSGPRALAFGNVYLRRVGRLDDSGRLTTCTTAFDGCTEWQLEPERLFSFRRRPADVSGFSGGDGESPRTALERLARGSQRWNIPGQDSPDLSDGDPNRDGSVVVLMPTEQQQAVHVGRLADLGPGSLVDVRMRVAAEGTTDREQRDARIWLVHDLKDGEGQPLYQQGVELADGQGVEFAYRARVESAGPGRVESRLWVARYQGADVKVRLLETHLEPLPRGNGEPTPPGAQPRFFDIESEETARGTNPGEER